jgi:sigma-B regulation protein RsbU (phosphoserine phosphatase)
MLSRINVQLAKHEISNRYAAMVFGVYDTGRRTLVLANSGFPRPLLVRDGEVSEVPIDGVPLGMFPQIEYREETLQLETGDVVVFSSDGIYESIGCNLEEFGDHKLNRLLVEMADRPAQQIADNLVASAEQYVRDSAMEGDDRTVVVLKVL